MLYPELSAKLYPDFVSRNAFERFKSNKKARLFIICRHYRTLENRSFVRFCDFVFVLNISWYLFFIAMVIGCW